MAITRTQLAKQLQDGLNAIFGLNYDSWPEEYPQFLDVETSQKAFEEERLLSGFGFAAEKQEGGAYAEDDGQEVWTKRYTHRTVGLSFRITEEAIEDNRYMDVGSRFSKALARSLRMTEELYAANILNRAVTAGYTGGDGVVLRIDGGRQALNGCLEIVGAVERIDAIRLHHIIREWREVFRSDPTQHRRHAVVENRFQLDQVTEAISRLQVFKGIDCDPATAIRHGLVSEHTQRQIDRDQRIDSEQFRLELRAGEDQHLRRRHDGTGLGTESRVIDVDNLLQHLTRGNIIVQCREKPVGALVSLISNRFRTTAACQGYNQKRNSK